MRKYEDLKIEGIQMSIYKIVPFQIFKLNKPFFAS